MDIEKIKTLVAEGRIEKALDEIILQINKISDKEIKNDFILQSSRLKRILREKKLGIETADNINITVNQITNGLLSMLDDIGNIKAESKQNENSDKISNSFLEDISSVVGFEVKSFREENKKSILHQLELYKINKVNLESAEKASAKWGELVPTIITHRINDEKEKLSEIITQIKKLL